MKIESKACLRNRISQNISNDTRENGNKNYGILRYQHNLVKVTGAIPFYMSTAFVGIQKERKKRRAEKKHHREPKVARIKRKYGRYERIIGYCAERQCCTHHEAIF